MDLRRGQEVDRYVVDGLIGSGGMALVYRVRHAQLGSLHAVKILRLPTPSIVRRLMQEGRAQSQLQHPNIVPVTDVIDVLGCPGLVMPWVDGPSLSPLVTQRQLAPSELAALAEGLFAAVGSAHRAGWIHRDLKAGNVMMQRIDDQLLPRVTDFGLVKALTGPHSLEPQTRTGAMMGTPAYMAPEQFADAGAVDHRADVYALGVILYEACVGRRPYDGGDPLGLLEQVRAADPPTVDSQRDDLPGLDALLREAMHPEPTERLPDVATFARRWAELGWPPPAWTPASVDLARRLTPSPTNDPIEPTSGNTTLSFSDPFATSELSGLSGTVDTASVRRVPPRSRVLPAVGATALLALIGLGSFALWEPPVPAVDVPTLESVPTVTADAAAQRQLEEGWQALLAGNIDEAERRIGAAYEAVPDHPLPALMLSYTLMRQGQFPRALQIGERAAKRHEDSEGAAGDLARAIGATHRSGHVDPPEMTAYRAAHPDDLLALLMAADFCAQDNAEACEVDLPALLEAAPRAPLTHRVVAQSWTELNRPEAALEAVATGLAGSPDDPYLLALRARIELGLGRLDAATETLDTLAAVDPSRLDTKIYRLKLAILKGDDALFDALRAELTSPSQEQRVRLTFFDVAANGLTGLGRTHEAEALMQEALELTSGNPVDSFWILLRLRGVATARGDLVAAADYVEQASVMAATNPEIRESDRDRLAGFVLSTQAMIALADGDVHAARAVADRLEAADNVPGDTTESVQRRVAAAEGDADRVVELDRTLWQGECARSVILADALVTAGAPERAAVMVRPVVDRCSILDLERATAVLGHVILAESTDDPEEARRAIARARELWPAADPDHRVVHRLSAVADARGVSMGP